MPVANVPSPLYHDGLLYVFKPGREFHLVATNDLGDGGFATPVVCGSRIYLRTRNYLYCLGNWTTVSFLSPGGPT
jgi:hypothetical protein